MPARSGGEQTRRLAGAAGGEHKMAYQVPRDFYWFKATRKTRGVGAPTSNANDLKRLLEQQQQKPKQQQHQHFKHQISHHLNGHPQDVRLRNSSPSRQRGKTPGSPFSRPSSAFTKHRDDGLAANAAGRPASASASPSGATQKVRTSSQMHRTNSSSGIPPFQLVDEYYQRQQRQHAQQKLENSRLQHTNNSLIEKNNMLRRELERLKRNREQRVQKRAVATASQSAVVDPASSTEQENHGQESGNRSSQPHHLNNNGESSNSLSQGDELGGSASVKTIELPQTRPVDDSYSERLSDDSEKIAAGTGVHAVRASASRKAEILNSLSSSGSSSSSEVEGKKDSTFKRQQPQSMPSQNSRTVINANSSSGTSASQERKAFVRPTSAHVFGNRAVTDSTATASPAASATRAEAASKLFRAAARPQSAKLRTSQQKKTSTKMRPSSAHPSKGASRTNTTSGKAFSDSLEEKTSPAATKAEQQAQQQAERKRIQSLIAAPGWDGKGKPDLYVFQGVLGQGSFGVVRSGNHKVTGHRVAVKIYERSRFKDANQLKRTHTEIKLHKLLNHVHIIRLFEVFETSKRIYIVMEPASKGNLCTYVKQRKRLSESESTRILYHIALALEFLHSNDIAHRDVKLENVLFDSNRVIKLADFGFATRCDDTKLLTTHCGTPSYMSPEIVRRKPYNGKRTDMWSLGVLFFSCQVGRFPFSAKTYPELYKKIARGIYHTPELLSTNARDILKGVLAVSPDARWTASQLKVRLLADRKDLAAINIPTANQCTHLISDKGADDITPALIKQLTTFGFPEKRLKSSIQNKEHNHLATTYYLLAMKAEKKRLLAKAQRAAAGSSTSSSSSTK